MQCHFIFLIDCLIGSIEVAAFRHPCAPKFQAQHVRVGRNGVNAKLLRKQRPVPYLENFHVSRQLQVILPANLIQLVQHFLGVDAHIVGVSFWLVEIFRGNVTGLLVVKPLLGCQLVSAALRAGHAEIAHDLFCGGNFGAVLPVAHALGIGFVRQAQTIHAYQIRRCASHRQGRRQHRRNQNAPPDAGMFFTLHHVKFSFLNQVIPQEAQRLLHILFVHRYIPSFLR